MQGINVYSGSNSWNSLAEAIYYRGILKSLVRAMRRPFSGSPTPSYAPHTLTMVSSFGIHEASGALACAGVCLGTARLGGCDGSLLAHSLEFHVVEVNSPREIRTYVNAHY